MKNKIQWILGIILCVTGLLFITLSLMFVNFDIEKYGNGSKFVEKKKDIDGEEIKNIQIDSVEADILIKESMDEVIHITYYENVKTKIEYNVYTRGTTLYMKRKSVFQLFNLNPFNFIGSGERNITVEIPKSKIDTLKANSVSGKIKIHKGNYKTIILKNTSGSIETHDIYAEDIDIKTVSGTINTDQLRGISLKEETVSGNISMTQIEADKIKTATVSGKTEGSIYGKEELYTINVKTVSGALNIANQKGTEQKSLSANSVSGSIQIKFYEK